MSGFFGIFRPQGGSFDLEAFDQMRKATEREGFDGMETHVQEKIAMGHLMLRVTPESKYDKQPLRSSCGNYLLVGHFRLDYRDELGDKLGLTQSELNITPDSQLVMLSYQKWNEKCVHHIEGDWAFVVYNAADNFVFTAKDKTGNSALFYFLSESAFCFSSELNVILNIKSLDIKVDKVQLGRLSINALGLSDGMTLFKNIFNLKSAEFLVIHDKLTSCKYQYWTLNEVQKVNYKFECDYIFEMFSIYQQAVKTRVSENKHGLLLSSGLDSTSVAYLTSKQLKVNEQTLYTFTSYPEFKYNLSKYRINQIDESDYVKSFVASHNNIVAEYLNFPNTNFKEVFEISSSVDAFFPVSTINSFWILGILSTAQNMKIKSLFTGQMGNYTISWYAPFELTKLLLRLQFRKIFKDLKGLSFYEKTGLYKECIKVFLSEIKGWLLHTIKYFLKKDELKNPFFVKSGFVSDKEWIDKLNRTNFLPNISYFSLFDSRKIRAALIDRTLLTSGYHWYAIGHKYSMHILDPTADFRLMIYSFSISELLFTQNAKKKYLFYQLMKNNLPSSILNAEFKIPQSADIGDKISHDQEFINEIIPIKLTEYENKFFEDRELKNHLQIILDIKKNIYIRRVHSNILLQKLSLIKFLRKYDKD